MEIWKRNLIVCWFGVLTTAAGVSQIAPVLPVYIEQLGVQSPDEVARWSGIIFGVTFVTMAIFSPIWGAAADRYGRKPMLLRASLGMAIILAAMGFAQNVYQLAWLRFFQGTVSGFYSAAITLVAFQTPSGKTGWALGVLSTGMVSGSLIGPLLGGYLSEVMGIKTVFITIGGLLLISFFLSCFFVKEEFAASEKKRLKFSQAWDMLPRKDIIIAAFVTCFVMQAALNSIQPIITVYVAKLSGPVSHLMLISGLIFAAPGLATLVAAPRIGALTDKIGPIKVMVVCLLAAGLLFVPQTMAQSSWELMGYRFLLGIATAGLLPALNTLLKQNSPDELIGRVFGYSQSAQFIGSFFGAVMGGEAASRFGVEYAFLFAGMLLLLNALWVYARLYRHGLKGSGC